MLISARGCYTLAERKVNIAKLKEGIPVDRTNVLNLRLP